jgi:hypothetical protein
MNEHVAFNLLLDCKKSSLLSILKEIMHNWKFLEKHNKKQNRSLSLLFKKIPSFSLLTQLNSTHALHLFREKNKITTWNGTKHTCGGAYIWDATIISHNRTLISAGISWTNERNSWGIASIHHCSPRSQIGPWRHPSTRSYRATTMQSTLSHLLHLCQLTRSEGQVLQQAMNIQRDNRLCFALPLTL